MKSTQSKSSWFNNVLSSGCYLFIYLTFPEGSHYNESISNNIIVEYIILLSIKIIHMTIFQSNEMLYNILWSAVQFVLMNDRQCFSPK